MPTALAQLPALPRNHSSGSRLTKKQVPATWDNVYQIYLRRTHVICMVETWHELGGSEGFPEISHGICGAFVRIYTKSPESILAGTYHLQQVEAMVAPTKPDEGVRLKLDGLERLVPVEKLSDKWPDESEIDALRVRIEDGRAQMLFEASMRVTVTRLAVIQHCRLLKSGQEPEEICQENITEVAEYLRLLVDDERRSMQSVGREREGLQREGSQRELTESEHPAEILANAEATEHLRRSQRAPAGGTKRDRTDSPQAGSDLDLAPMGGTEQLVPLGDRKPVIANMKARKLVSLNELMITAENAPCSP